MSNSKGKPVAQGDDAQFWKDAYTGAVEIGRRQRAEIARLKERLGEFAGKLTARDAEIAALKERVGAAEADARRYKVAREFIAPRFLSDRLNLEWADISKEQSIAEKIDELCDAALSATDKGER